MLGSAAFALFVVRWSPTSCLTPPNASERGSTVNTRADTRQIAPWVGVGVATAVAYAAFGLLALLIAIPPGFASPLFPAAGIALACVLVHGLRALPGVMVGALAVQIAAGLDRGLAWDALAVPVAISAGATLQAWFGSQLVRRFVGQPLTLSEPRDIAAFFGLGAFAACIVSASASTVTLGLSGELAPDRLPFHWLTWWVGDSLGTLITTPIALTLIGRPREEWAARRLTVGLTLTTVCALLAAMIMLIVRWDEERLRGSFERDALAAASTLSLQLATSLHALEALRDTFLGSDDVTSDEMRRATRSWLTAANPPRALGYVERVPRAELADHEARRRGAGLADYRVYDAGGGSPAGRSDGGAPGEGDLMVVRDVEPAGRAGTELGLNVMSIDADRAALEASARSDQPYATRSVPLERNATGGEPGGVLVYHALYAGNPSNVRDRLAAWRGAVFVTLNVDDVLRGVRAGLPRQLNICVIDNDATAVRRRVAGPAGCEEQAPMLLHAQPLPFAGRPWELHVYPSGDALDGLRGRDWWLLSVSGLLAAAVLTALLLLVTGRTRRIEAAVRERTAALTEQVREREQAQAAMRESEQRFRNIFNHVPIGVCYTDLRGYVKNVNPRFCQLVGHTEEEVLSMRSSDFTHPEDVAYDRELTLQLLRGETPMYRRHKRYIERSGRILWVQATVSLLRDEDGEPRRIVAAVEDITEHLRLAEAERAREAAEASNRAKSEFLSRMSHELRTPLNAMLGFAQLLELDRRFPLADSQRPWVGQIQQAGWHLLEMINDVLDLSRIESGNLRLTVETLELVELVAATTALVEGAATQRGIRIGTELAPGATRVRGDATRVKQILTNLLSNAVKYNVDNGRVQVASRLVDDAVEISVTDTGLGMTPAQMSELFQPFNRLGRERSGTEGTGIGLVVSQRLAELMGGTLRARSTDGQGSSFILSLPGVAESLTVRSPLDPTVTGPAEYHRRLVHYVEDNETNIEVMRGVLAQRPQVQMEVSITGLDGLAAIHARRPDIVLLDMHLPDIGGLELLRYLKNDPRTADIPVIVVSADALASQVQSAMEAGALRYLTKPVSVSELLALIDEVLDEAQTRYG